ncbi:hypothetical protein T492DRAFT_849898 [Pavlovales sp. CCMP2436]|nr:hypothetical protein T492DRAFT_849898 [Pavlovales sp. CCMP2436]
MPIALLIGTLVVAAIALVIAATALMMMTNPSSPALDGTLSAGEFVIVITGPKPIPGPSPAISALKALCAYGMTYDMENYVPADCFKMTGQPAPLYLESSNLYLYALLPNSCTSQCLL